MRVKLAGLLALMAIPTAALANPFEDTFGMGARVRGMGGAGTTVATDYAAVYHNPGALGFCPHTSVSVGWTHLEHQLWVDQSEPNLEARPVEPRDRVAVGLCLRLPFDFSLGVHLSLGVQKPMVLDQQSIDDQPRFLMHNERLDHLSIIVGGAYRIIDQLSVGVGITVLASSQLSLDNSVPVVTQSHVRNDLHWDLNPTAAIYVGALGEPWPGLKLGVVYRSSLYHELNVQARTRVEMAGVLIDVDLLLQGVMWYSPQQVGWGASYTFLDGLTIAADATWYQWSAYPGPFIVASPLPESDVAASLSFPPREDIPFSDIVVPRLGLEYVIADMVPLRAGYSLQFSPVPAPTGLSNLLDSDTHVVSLGAGFRWTPPPLAEGEDPLVAALVLDAYGRLGIMTDREVNKSGSQARLNRYHFGGLWWDAGLTASVEY